MSGGTRADLPGDLGGGRLEHERAVDRQDVLDPERLRAGSERDRLLHRRDVAEDGPGRLVTGAVLVGFRAGQATLGEDEPLDAGGRNGFRAEQAAGQNLEAGQTRRIAVQRVDGALGCRDGGSDVRGNGELQGRDRIGNERLVKVSIQSWT